MVPHFPPKPHLEQQEFKNHFMSQLEPIVKLPTCQVLTLPTCNLVFMLPIGSPNKINK